MPLLFIPKQPTREDVKEVGCPVQQHDLAVVLELAVLAPGPLRSDRALLGLDAVFCQAGEKRLGQQSAELPARPEQAAETFDRALETSRWSPDLSLGQYVAVLEEYAALLETLDRPDESRSLHGRAAGIGLIHQRR